MAALSWANANLIIGELLELDDRLLLDVRECKHNYILLGNEQATSTMKVVQVRVIMSLGRRCLDACSAAFWLPESWGSEALLTLGEFKAMPRGAKPR